MITQKHNEIKVCRVCGVTLTEENWCPSSRKSNSYICTKCATEQCFYRRHKGENIEYSERRRQVNHKDSKIKYCRKCFTELVEGVNLTESQIKHGHYLCNNCYNIWRALNKDEINEYRKKRNRNNYIGTTDEEGNKISIKCVKRPHTLKCELCSKDVKKTVYHHWDDNNPEWGMWVCTLCHITIERLEEIPNIKILYENLKRKIENER